MEYVHNIPNFEEPFLKFLESRKKLKTLRSSFGENEQPALIHFEKLGDIGHELEKMGLATYKDYPWYEVSPWVAKSFMSYLASTIGLLPEVNAAPVTYDSTSFSLLGGKSKFGIPQQVTNRDEIRSLILEDLFPYPTALKSIDHLLEFKETHQPLLLNLRNYIEQQCIDISNITDHELRVERLELFIKKVNNDTDNLIDVMKTKWTEIAFSTFAPLLGAGAALQASDPFTNIIAGGGAGLSLFSAIYQAFKTNRNDQVINQSPLAYAVYYKRLETRQ